MCSSTAFDWSGTDFECVVESDECNAPTIDCNADAVGMETRSPSASRVWPLLHRMTVMRQRR